VAGLGGIRQDSAAGRARHVAERRLVAEDIGVTRWLTASGWGDGDELGRAFPVPSDSAEAAAPLDALAEDGHELVAAAYLLASEIFQQFGLAETPQITRDGALRIRHWSPQSRPAIQAWADSAAITVNGDMIPV
jgi:hypothetical protein